jgi:hypothetical protein
MLLHSLIAVVKVKQAKSAYLHRVHKRTINAIVIMAAGQTSISKKVKKEGSLFRNTPI